MRNSPHWERDKQTESERIENEIPSKWNMKAIRSSYTHI
jgi:hypothetical protein